jgi:hypothetical protein
LEEFNARTDPQKADTDGDGLKDGAEVKANQTNPLRADTDGDGLTDGNEVTVRGTDPLKKDTDGDGFSDAVEVAEGTDAKSPSSVLLISLHSVAAFSARKILSMATLPARCQSSIRATLPISMTAF